MLLVSYHAIKLLKQFSIVRVLARNYKNRCVNKTDLPIRSSFLQQGNHIHTVRPAYTKIMCRDEIKFDYNTARIEVCTLLTQCALVNP